MQGWPLGKIVFAGHLGVTGCVCHCRVTSIARAPWEEMEGLRRGWAARAPTGMWLKGPRYTPRVGCRLVRWVPPSGHREAHLDRGSDDVRSQRLHAGVHKPMAVPAELAHHARQPAGKPEPASSTAVQCAAAPAPHFTAEHNRRQTRVWTCVSLDGMASRQVGRRCPMYSRELGPRKDRVSAARSCRGSTQ